MNHLLTELARITTEAAGIIREVYETQFAVEYKAPRDPVTAADRRANALICERLRSLEPSTPIVAEESDPSTFAGYRSSRRIFFVDPLDGTREFVDRNGEFVVMIGLVDGDDAVAGVVHAPAQRRIWVGLVGEGAFELEEGGAPKPISVSAAASTSKSRVVASRSHRSPMLGAAIERLGTQQVLAVGSAGLKGARVATAAADVYLGPGRAGKRWDACAVDAIVTAAGGKVTDAKGDRFDYRAPSLDNETGILATNGALHDAVLSCIAPIVRG